MNALKMILDDEGFESKPYKDTLGNWTFGHGLTYITKEESERIVKERIEKINSEFEKLKWYRMLDKQRKQAIINMGYQLGVKGVKGFKKMIRALGKQDWNKAHEEALDSAWAVQTPQRAARVAEILRTGKLGD